MHPRVSLHQVAFMAEPTAAFVAYCCSIGVQHCTLVTPKLEQPDALSALLAESGVKAGCINHPFALHPDLERDSGGAAAGLMRAIDSAAELGAPSIYLITGGRGSLSWEQAAERFAELLAPCRDAAQQKGVALLVENASALNVDIHIAHTLPDATRLARIAGTGLCIDIHACWMEGALKEHLAAALPLAGLVQVSDYVLADRTAPCRAVPGDGAIPLERIVGDILELGYNGLFDLELVGPRIASEGPASACARAADGLSNLLVKLGA
ncbi:sugar phosphate isomerase/epimerase family protein [Novosphingobium beihaiensis]|uniref:Sugar phosphate isomerase/epimerase n=1 Tax=Novosphingobium beihaiensis TaxID=2930389 RepID=A0ABT0BPM3_9SPHN|nr:sugar phosphate isomerase/epimerase [Novosphingobium beihaiensis]MCJ2186900.1 sugar phosphate isomerase/epimerase [Novosphingobium beihaiensis]